MGSKIEDLKPDSQNANRGTERGLAMLEDSLRKYGAGRSILVDKTGAVIAGNKTLETAADLGFPVRVVKTDGRELVVVQREDLDLEDGDGKARELAYADNRSSQVGLDWDLERILADVEAGVDFAGLWSEAELAELLKALAEPKEDPGAQIDRAEELREKWQTERGQIWQVGRHRLMCGDSTSEEDVRRLMDGIAEWTLLADPPYGIDAANMQMGIGKRDFPRHGEWDAERVNIGQFVDSAKTAIVWGGNYYTDILPVSADWLCWDKKNTGLSYSEFELAWTNTGHRARIIGHHWSGEEKQHITQKPLPVIAWSMGFLSSEWPTYDPFLGSGTTMVAAEQLGRICYGMEIEAKYVAVTLERMAGMGLEARLL